TSILVSGGVNVAVPLVTSYTNLATGGDQYRTLQASGAGSVLDLRNVTSITNGTAYDTNLSINALAGGVVNLAGTTHLADATTGDFRYRAINLSADGSSSSINLSALTSFLDYYAGNTNGENRSSSLAVTNGGTIQAPLLTTLQGVAFTLDGSGTLPTAQITTLTVCQLTLTSATTFNFSGLTTATASVLTLSGTTPYDF